MDATKEHNFMGRAASLKFGGTYTFKQRGYEIRNFQIIPQGVAISGDPDQLFQEENLWPTNSSASQGTRYEALFLPHNPNQYDVEATNTALYLSEDFSPTQKLKAVL